LRRFFFFESRNPRKDLNSFEILIYRRTDANFANANRVGNEVKPCIMGWMIKDYVGIARAITWIGILAIIILSVVPAADRPVTGAGQTLEHLTVFAILGCAFAIGYRLSLIRSMLLAVLFCAGIELLQIPVPTRHARVSDFLVDTAGASFAILCVFIVRQIPGARLPMSMARLWK
jgi:hypothetical protein